MVLIDPPTTIDDGREDYIVSFAKPTIIVMTTTMVHPSVELLHKKYRARVTTVSSCKLQGAKKIKFLLNKLEKGK